MSEAEYWLVKETGEVGMFVSTNRAIVGANGRLQYTLDLGNGRLRRYEAAELEELSPEDERVRKFRGTGGG